ncbi:MAG: hypothetical protein FWE82_01440 [Defluviitaleaceae bacterium]|nr:hypothetical protein [Defluviitaleaceae bacterium]
MTDSISKKINGVLSGGSKQNAIAFVKFLDENGYDYDWPSDGSGCGVNKAGKNIAYLMIDDAENMPGPWTCWFNSCEFDESGAVDDTLKETAWRHASVCGHFESGGKACGCGDQPGFTRKIFGKEFKNRCHSPLMFVDPDQKTLGEMTRLMQLL